VNLAVIEAFSRLLGLLFLAGLLLGRAAATEVPSAPPAPSCGLPFAIADFDGDSHPDLASVESGNSEFPDTQYWIQLRLSAAGWQSIQVLAPAGGLQIAARDVNGDEWVDLVVSTAWSNRPVAVYLNDGHGSFTHADPAAFPEAFSESKTNWSPAANQAAETAVAPVSSGAGIREAESDLLDSRSPAGLISATRAGFPISPFLLLHAGRAPPSEVSHFQAIA
jgi:FG-GAP-like repeat